jgi:hypothetical protein
MIAQRKMNVHMISKNMAAILKNAELRGENNLAKLTPRISSLPVNLLQYEVITQMEPVSDKAFLKLQTTFFA